MHSNASYLLEFAPQLAIPGFANNLEESIDQAFRLSVREHSDRRARQDSSGRGLTTNGLCPACDEVFALRHPTFGDYEPAMVACGFVQGNGGGLGPHTSAYPAFDYLIWLLSSLSGWLPWPHHAYLLQGMKEWVVWPWFGKSSDSDYSGVYAGALWRQLRDAVDRSSDSIKMTAEAESDLQDRIQHSCNILGLPESGSVLVDRFMAEHIIETWISEETEMRNRRK